VALFSDDALARDGLRARLAAQPELEVAAAEQDAEVLLVDLGGGPGASEPALPAGIPWIALVPGAGDLHAALAAGAAGVLWRDAPPDRLAAAALAVAEGLVVLEPEAMPFRTAAALDAPLEPLTPRERQVLPLLADGLSNRGIAERLGISEHTAKFHVNAILGKLGAATRAEAVALAARQGLLHL
jgi:DNA-binding NarL/FixJ family response regulator